MCILCIEIEKEKLLPQEALRNYIEIAESLDEHAEEALEVVQKYIEEKNFCIWCLENNCKCTNSGWSII